MELLNSVADSGSFYGIQINNSHPDSIKSVQKLNAITIKECQKQFSLQGSEGNKLIKLSRYSV